jgi:predicted nucleic acid-binding protein
MGISNCRQSVVPDEVVSEITDTSQAEMVQRLIREGILEKTSVSGTAELAEFADLSSKLGLGESACLAIARERGWLIACDEKRFFLREATSRLGTARILNTPGIYVLCIRAGLLPVEEADAAKAVLEQHRYKMAFSSFRELT